MTQTLTEFIGKLERLSSGGFIGEVRRQVATDGLRLIAAGYRDSVDPYGASWQPLKYRNGKPLVLTGAFRDSWMAYPTPTGVRFLSGVDYGAYHQYGTRTIPFRRVIPMQNYGLPKPWTDVIAKAYSKQVREAVS
jgi:phage gpG-like protein